MRQWRRYAQHEAGKGFAVVADEVQSLANKSTESAKNIAELIEKSIQQVKNGAALSVDTMDALMQVIAGGQQSTEMIERIAESAMQHKTVLGTGDGRNASNIRRGTDKRRDRAGVGGISGRAAESCTGFKDFRPYIPASRDETLRCNNRMYTQVTQNGEMLKRLE